MKHMILAVVAALFFLGCSDKSADDANVEAQLIKGKSLEQLKLNDQFDKPHTLDAGTKKVIFAFTKDMGHLSNDFFATQKPDYLAKRNALFVADVSQAPSIIRSMFVLPGLKDFKHTVLVLIEDTDSANYRAETDFEKVLIADVDNFIITNIAYVSTAEELQQALQ